MKKKDILVMVFCFVIILSVIVYLAGGFKLTGKAENQKPTETTRFSGQIDEEAVKSLKEKENFGTLSEENIGRSNPFANL